MLETQICWQTNFYFSQIFSETFAAIHEITPVLVLNKPIYVRFTVLELSKYLMYDFHQLHQGKVSC